MYAHMYVYLYMYIYMHAFISVHIYVSIKPLGNVSERSVINKAFSEIYIDYEFSSLSSSNPSWERIHFAKCFYKGIYVEIKQKT